MPSQNNSAFSFQFPGIIWKILPDQESTLLALETREEAGRKASFAAIDLESNKLLWEKRDLPEQWWIGLFDAVNENVLLHGFKDYQNPEHKGIYVLDGRTGTLLWKNEMLAPVNAADKLLLVKDMEKHHSYHLLDTGSGSVIKEINEEDVPAMQGQLKLQKTHKVKNSIKYTPESPHFSKLSTFVEVLTGHQPLHVIEYLEHKDKIITGFYFKKGENLVNYLFVTDEEGAILYSTELAENLKGIAEESFFLTGDRMVCIKNRKELIIFEL